MSRLVARAGRRFFVRHPWQLALAIVGVALGVAVVTGVDLAGSAARRAFDASREAVVGEATHQIVSRTGLFDDAVFRTLAVDAGLRKIAPVLEGRIATEDGRVLTLTGIDPFSEPPFRNYGTSAGAGGPVGTFLTQPGAVLATENLAAELGIAAGDTLRVTAAGEPRTLKLVGFLEPGPTEEAILDDYLFADMATAQEILAHIGSLSRIDLILDDAAVDAVRAGLSPGLELISTGVRSQNMEEMTRAFRVNLFALSLLALLVGAFLIYSTMSFLVVQRRNVIGTLRTMGVSRRQLFMSVIQESFLVGIPGTVIGLLLGWLLGHGLTSLVVRTIDDLYFRLQVTGVPFEWSIVVKVVLLGLGVTVAASLGPAREAAMVSPRTVLSRASLERHARRRLPGLVLFAAVVMAVAAVLLTTGSGSLVPGFAGMFAVIVAAALLTPPAIVLMMDFLAKIIGPASDLPLRMAIRGVTASLSRTGVSVAALMVAVATVIGVGLMVGSFRASVDQWLADSLRSDVYISLDEIWYTDGGDGDRLAAALAELREVSLVSRSTRTRLAGKDGEIRLWALDSGHADWGLSLISGDAGEARRSFDAGRSVLISEPFARRSGLSVGESLELPTPRGTVELPIAGIFRDYTSDRGVVAIHMNRFRSDWEERRLDGLGLLAGDGVDTSDLRRAADRLLGDARGVRVASNSEIRAVSLSIFDRTFTITRVLQVLVGVVAFLGVLSALQSLQMERVREMAVLRALGWTPTQIRRLVIGQTALLGTSAGLLAMPLGIVLAVILIHVINLRAFAWTMGFEMDPGVLAQGLLLAAVAAYVGGLYPAWRSASRRPAADLRDE